MTERINRNGDLASLQRVGRQQSTTIRFQWACSGLHSAERYEFNVPCSHPNLSTPSHQAPCRNLQLTPGLFSCIHMAHPYAPSHQLAENQDYEAHPPGERQESNFLYLALKHV